jgi:Asp-tRNA(Asn)/Glu-tRNA(Gln) amidotransferase A subunit family amidase
MLAHAKPSISVLDTAADLANGRTSSRDLIEAALAQIADPAGEGARTFVKVYGNSARAGADAQDRLRKAGYVASPLAGLPVSLKDLFDVSGERTLAGSKALDDGPPGERTRIVNRIKSTLARLGIRNFKPTLRKAADRLATVHTPEGVPLPPRRSRLRMTTVPFSSTP